MIDRDAEVLIVIDVQNDFCAGGNLAVPGGDDILPVVNDLMRGFRHVVLTQDWHPAGHSSFASTHPGRKPFELVEMPYGPQTLWPDHCVKGEFGAAFHRQLDAVNAELILRKGFRTRVDSYSAFFENDHLTPTGLGGYLQERGFKRVVLAGLAFDYCVRYSAEDGRRLGFETIVMQEASRAIDLNGSVEAAKASFERLDIRLM